MKCFEHLDQEAVGVCRACGRAVCRECFETVENRVVCRGRCADDLQKELRIINASESMIGQRSSVLATTGGAYRRTGAMYVILGLGMIVFSAATFINAGANAIPGYVLAALGVFFLVSAAGNARAASQYRKMAGTPQSTPKA